MLSHYELAIDEGAEVVTGGGIPRFGDGRDRGFYVQPTILVGLEESARTNREEIFGPVCHVAPFDTEEEAIRNANDTRYGLALRLDESSEARSSRRREPEVGITWVNAGPTCGLRSAASAFRGSDAKAGATRSTSIPS